MWSSTPKPPEPKKGPGLLETRLRSNIQFPGDPRFSDPKPTSSASYKPPMSKDALLKKTQSQQSSWFSPLYYMKNLIVGKPATENAAAKKHGYVPRKAPNAPNKPKPVEPQSNKQAPVKETGSEIVKLEEKHFEKAVQNEDTLANTRVPGARDKRVKELLIPVVDEISGYVPIRFVENKSTYLHAPDTKGATSFRISTTPRVAVPVPAKEESPPPPQVQKKSKYDRSPRRRQRDLLWNHQPKEASPKNNLARPGQAYKSYVNPLQRMKTDDPTSTGNLLGKVESIGRLRSKSLEIEMPLERVEFDPQEHKYTAPRDRIRQRRLENQLIREEDLMLTSIDNEKRSKQQNRRNRLSNPEVVKKMTNQRPHGNQWPPYETHAVMKPTQLESSVDADDQRPGWLPGFAPDSDNHESKSTKHCNQAKPRSGDKTKDSIDQTLVDSAHQTKIGPRSASPHVVPQADSRSKPGNRLQQSRSRHKTTESINKIPVDSVPQAEIGPDNASHNSAPEADPPSTDNSSFFSTLFESKNDDQDKSILAPAKYAFQSAVEAAMEALTRSNPEDENPKDEAVPSEKTETLVESTESSSIPASQDDGEFDVNQITPREETKQSTPRLAHLGRRNSSSTSKNTNNQKKGSNFLKARNQTKE